MSVIDLTTSDAEEDAPAAQYTDAPRSLFPDGAFKLTFNHFACPGRADYLSFDEIIGDTGEIRKIVLSSYCIEDAWLYDKLRSISNVTVISHYDREREQPRPLKHPSWSNVTIVRPEFPKFPAYGVMHSKVILIWRASGLRVVVSTGNLMEHDYGVVQNALFIQDLPALEEPDVQEGCQFKADLERTLVRLGLKSYPLNFDHFDWSRVKAILIASEPGNHFIDGRSSTGLVALQRHTSRFISCLPCEATVEYQCSSLGKLDSAWLGQFLSSACGAASSQAPDRPQSRFKIVFPTLESVQRSPLGPGAFGTIFCKSKDWQASSTPRSSFYQCSSWKLKGRPLHTKLMVVEANEQPAYYYLGSHNFTAAAWGRFVKDGKQLMVCNFELGVLLRPEDYPITWPYDRPAQPYASTDTPWIQGLSV